MRAISVVSSLVFSLSSVVAMAEPPVAADDSASTSPTPPTVNRECLKETGSHVRRHNGDECISAHGRVYSREEVELGGIGDVGRSLQHLDPSISTGHR